MTTLSLKARPSASGRRWAFAAADLAKRFANRLVLARLMTVDCELRRLGHEPLSRRAEDFLPFKL